MISAARRVQSLAPPSSSTWAGRQKAVLQNLSQLQVTTTPPPDPICIGLNCGSVC